MADTDKGPVLVSLRKNPKIFYVGVLVESRVTGKHVRVVLRDCKRIAPIEQLHNNDNLSEYSWRDLYPGYLASIGIPADWWVGDTVFKTVLTRVDEISFLSEASWASVKDRQATPPKKRQRFIEQEEEQEQDQEEPEPLHLRLPDTQTEVSPSTGEPSPDIQPVKETQSTPE